MALKIPFDCTALVLQGGGALGAYQCGVYEALADADIQPGWVSGISIGAINAAIIAGNSPADRVGSLREFWNLVSGRSFGEWVSEWFGYASLPTGLGDATHGALDQISALHTALSGTPGFFQPRMPPAWIFPTGNPATASFYDTDALVSTLERLVDFDRINSGEIRFSVGAVNVRTGNFVYFDNQSHTIEPKHILASGALPPGFPAVEIDGEYYWDGGLVSNTPLNWVVDSLPRQNLMVFQVDLWSSRGELPRNLTDVAVRQKEIQFSSRTRASSNRIKHMQKIRAAIKQHLDSIPEHLLQSEAARLLVEFSDLKACNVVQLVYRSKNYEGNSKDFEFSRLSMNEHWAAGRQDADRALGHTEIFEPPSESDGFKAFDFGWHGENEKAALGSVD